MKSKFIYGAFVLAEEDKMLVYNPNLNTTAILPLKNNDIEQTIRANREYLANKNIMFFEEDFKKYNKITDYFSKRDGNNNKIITITDAMSFDCNLKCVYCMQQNTQKNTIYISPNERAEIWKSIADSFAAKKLFICLFGGEPFYDCKYVETLLDSAYNLDIPISGIIAVTNGTIASEEVISLINKYEINSLQITIDGPKEVHDSRRISRDGLSSFDRIFSNLRIFLDQTKTNIIINTVLDRNNKDYYIDLIKEIIAEFSIETLSASPRIIFNLGSECHPYKQSKYTNENILKAEENDVYFNNLWKALRLGVTFNYPFPGPRCIATSVNEIVLGPDCSIYSCISGIGNKEFLIASRDEYLKSNDTIFIKQIIAKNKDRYSTCMDCSYYALCNGGCYYNMINENKSSSCQKQEFYYTIDEYVKLAVYLKQTGPFTFKLES